MDRDKIHEIYQNERSKLFHYLLNNPLNFKKLTKRRLVETTKNYFKNVYHLNGEDLGR